MKLKSERRGEDEEVERKREGEKVKLSWWGGQLDDLWVISGTTDEYKNQNQSLSYHVPYNQKANVSHVGVDTN